MKISAYIQVYVYSWVHKHISVCMCVFGVYGSVCACVHGLCVYLSVYVRVCVCVCVLSNAFIIFMLCHNLFKGMAASSLSS